MNTLLRAWGRVRRPISTGWEAANAAADIWGVDKGRSSSSSAFDRTLNADIAQILDKGSITIMLDLWKAFETVPPEALMSEAERVGCPRRLMGMFMLSYREPGVLNAHQSCSAITVAHHGNLAGCSHAATCLSVL